MNISSISSSAAVTDLSSVSSVSQVSSQGACEVGGTGQASGDTSSVSKMGQLMTQLQDLEKTDPDKAKSVLSSIADSLKKAANANGTTDPKLSALADKFSQAAQTGDLSGLQQPQGAQGGGHGHHHHHHHGGGGGGAQGSSGSTSTASSTSSQMQAYQQNAANPMSQVEGIISQALGAV